MTVVAASYGAGVQSTAMLVLAAQGKIEPRLFIFANVGDDSEHPDSLRYFREVATPYAAEHGIELVEVQRTWKRGERAGTPNTLYAATVDPTTRSVPIPVRMARNGAPGNRSCTSDWKIKVIGEELRRRGATAEDPAIVSMGISVDEIERARPGTDPRMPYQSRVYPLLDLGMNRRDCQIVIADAGLPVPPKSSCWFCPFHDVEAWRRLRSETPDLWAKAIDMEAQINATRHRIGRDDVYLTRFGKPLAEVLDDQLSFDGMDGCDSGWCMT